MSSPSASDAAAGSTGQPIEAIAATVTKSKASDQLPLEALEQHPLRFEHGCEAVRLHRGARSWASMTSLDGIIGMFGTCTCKSMTTR